MGYALNPSSWEDQDPSENLAFFSREYLSEYMGLTESEADGLMTLLLGTPIANRIPSNPSVYGFSNSLEMRRCLSSLPQSAGIYFFSLKNEVQSGHTCLDGHYRSIAFDCSFPIYIGKTSNLKNRMLQHHRMPAFDLLINCGQKVYFRYFAENDFIKLSNIEYVERKLIECFKPSLNETKVESNYFRPDNNIETLPRVNLSPILSVV
jgi:hypothetical protein